MTDVPPGAQPEPPSPQRWPTAPAGYPIPPQYGAPYAPPPYGYPPPRGRSPWLWIAVGAGAMFAVCVVAAVIGLVAFGLAFEGSDGFGSGEEYVVSQDEVTDAVSGPCQDMRDAAKEIDVFASPSAGAASLRAYVATVHRIMDAIDRSHPDADARAWSQDWQVLSEALQAHADRLARGTSHYRTPTDDQGDPITLRMYWGSPDGCEVPLVIDALDPQTADSITSY